ncbi:peptide ABC transporter substrate-binding protein [Miniphocaeibacter massiliensis]|uniref:peptide ABC transporter substrate-binding protein n=1 Tax=Miniphocaeibacter massiliensis TaxID=2041841 RepID=UPI000C1C5327|nr:peptide ABC transporter substrate-binding protein [Miniphocaeibacter massiliensis]
MKKFRIGALLLTIIMCLAACGGGDKKAGKSGDGNSFTTYIVSEPSTLDAQKGSDIYSWAVLKSTMEPLVRLVENSEGGLEIENAGAESYEVSEDKKVYTFKIRDNKWTDGEKVTAEDYAYGIKRSVDPSTGAEMGFLLTNIKNAQAVISKEKPVEELGVKAIDEKTLEITLEEPAEYFIKIATQRIMFPQRKDIIEKYGDQFGSDKDKFIGNGPFVLSEWVHNSEVKLTKSDNYWDKDKVKLDSVNIKILSDENTYSNSFDTGEIETVMANKAQWRDKFMDKEGVKNKTLERPIADYIAFNTKDKYFSNAKIRRAFQLGIDRDKFSEAVTDGIAKPAYGWVPPTINAGEIEYRSKVEEPLVSISKESDPRKLLEEGLKELGITEAPENIEFTISFGDTSQKIRTYAEFMQSSYKDNLGVNVKLDFNEWPIYFSKMNKGDYQFGYLAWTADFDDPYAMLSVFLSNAGNVNTGWVNEEYDNLVIQGGKENDTEKAIELYKKAENILLEEASISPLLYGVSENFQYEYVKNFSVNDLSTQGFKYVDTSDK